MTIRWGEPRFDSTFKRPFGQAARNAYGVLHSGAQTACPIA